MALVSRAMLDLFNAWEIHHRFGGGERWEVGDELRFARDGEIEPFAHILAGYALPARMGAFSYAMSELLPHVRLGRYCSIASGVEFVDSQHPTGWASSHPFSYSPYGLQGMRNYLVSTGATSFRLHPAGEFMPRPVNIGHDVWVGQGALFMDGVSVGDGAIVAARALVTADVPPYAIVGGSPAKIIRMRFPEPLAERLRALAWWRFGPDVLQPLDVRQPEQFADRLEALIAETGPAAFTPNRLKSAEIAETAGEPG